MKNKFLLCIMLVLIIAGLYVPASYSQIPTYNCILANDVQTAPNVYEFDVFLLRTGTVALELGGFQIGLTYDTSALNGGTLTATWVTGTTDPIFQTYEQLPNPAQYSSGIIRVASFQPPGRGKGTIIPNVTPGARIGRLRLTNSAPFRSTPLSANWVFSKYQSKMSAYIAGTNTDITNQLAFLNSGSNPFLPVELTSFVSNVSGRQVNLSWATKTEINSNKYEIERALVSTKDATVTWASVGVVPASGSSNSPRQYSYTEKDLQAGKYQYRLKMIDNNGSYKYSDVVETEIALPKNFEISQNYPNPFNPTTRINYNLAFDSRVTIEVYDITGERMGQIVNEEQSAGYYTINFNSSTLNRSIASGVYLYRIIAVNKSNGNVYSSNKKMMLLK
jgi:hypothetical protein